MVYKKLSNKNVRCSIIYFTIFCLNKYMGTTLVRLMNISTNKKRTWADMYMEETCGYSSSIHLVY